MADYAAARRVLQKHLTDSCRITRDAQGYHDDVLDIGTGQLVPVTNTRLVYDGPCLVSPTGIGKAVEGSRVTERRGYRIRLPHDCPHLVAGDIATVTSADPELDGRQLRLVDSTQGATLDPGATVQAEDVDVLGPATG